MSSAKSNSKKSSCPYGFRELAQCLWWGPCFLGLLEQVFLQQMKTLFKWVLSQRAHNEVECE